MASHLELFSSVFLMIALAKDTVSIRAHIHDLDFIGEENVLVRMHRA